MKSVAKTCLCAAALLILVPLTATGHKVMVLRADDVVEVAVLNDGADPGIASGRFNVEIAGIKDK